MTRMPPEKKVATLNTTRTVVGLAPTNAAIPPKTPVRTRSVRERLSRCVVAGRRARRWSWGKESRGSLIRSPSYLHLNKRELRAQVGILESSGDFGLELPHLYPLITVGQVLEMG